MASSVPFETDMATSPRQASQPQEPCLSADAILSAVADYRGRFIDADRCIEANGSQMIAGADGLRRFLVARGLVSGDRVVMAVGNGPQFVVALVALIGAGASPILVHASTPVAELERIARRYAAEFLLSDEAAADDWVGVGITAERVAIERRNEFWWGQLRASGASGSNSYPATPGVPLHPTSGTTGLPKLALRPGVIAIAEAAHYAETIGPAPCDVVMALTPMSHAYAFGVCVTLPLITHATVVSQRRFSAAPTISAIARYGVTILPAVPAMLDVLLFGAGAKALSAPRMVLSAGAPLSRRTVERFRAATGHLPCPLYGATETGGITVATAGVAAGEFGCVGPPMRGVEVRLGSSEGSLPSADVGRVEIRSSSMMLGYLAADGVEPSVDADSWFRTGDLGRIDAQGRLHLLGRETEVINVVGMKVVPSEVEDVITQMPGVVECKVYAGEYASGSQFVKAAVVGDSPQVLERLREHCAKHLVYYKRPQRFFSLEALPRSAAGKILRDQLP